MQVLIVSVMHTIFIKYILMCSKQLLLRNINIINKILIKKAFKRKLKNVGL